MRILAVSLDLDDTLWPVEPAIGGAEQALDAWLRQHLPAVAQAWPIAALRELRDRISAQRPDLAHDFTAQRLLTLRHALRSSGIDSEALVQQAFEVYFKARNDVSLYADALPALTALAARVPLVSISNGNADLARIGLQRHFRASFSARELGMAKPSAGIFHAACAGLGLAPEHVLHVGDDPELDVAGARSAGLRSAWLNRSGGRWPTHGALAGVRPDLELRDLGELASRILAATDADTGACPAGQRFCVLP